VPGNEPCYFPLAARALLVGQLPAHAARERQMLSTPVLSTPVLSMSSIDRRN